MEKQTFSLKAFITNLGKYNEGELVGEWVKFPTTSEELQQVFERIGIGAKDEFGNTYEEWFISDNELNLRFLVNGVAGLYSEFFNKRINNSTLEDLASIAKEKLIKKMNYKNVDKASV